jgi:uncharacterized protein (TIGR00245 family)
MQCLGFSPRLLGMALLTVALLAQVDVNGFAFPNHLRRSSQQTSITANSGNVASILLLQRQKRTCRDQSMFNISTRSTLRYSSVRRSKEDLDASGTDPLTLVTRQLSWMLRRRFLQRYRILRPFQQRSQRSKTLFSSAKRLIVCAVPTVTALATLLLMTSFTGPAGATVGATTKRTITASASAAATLNTLPAVLSSRQVLWAAGLVTLSGGVGFAARGLPDLAASLLQACLRCTVQLYLAGGFLLTRILSTQHPAFVVAWIALTVLVGTFEAASRVGDYTYRDVRRHLWIALATSGGMTLTLTAVLRILGTLDPWFAPRTWIPVSGMLFGNVLTAATIAASSLTSQLVTQQNGIEWQLCRGASVKEALQETRRVAATNALTPVLNMLSVAGVVHVPGMMTGQLLAGQAPYQAAAYQVVIFFLIAATASTTVQILLQLGLQTLVDNENDRLQLATVERIPQRNMGNPSSKVINLLRDTAFSVRKMFGKYVLRTEDALSSPTSPPQRRSLILAPVLATCSASGNSNPPILRLINTTCHRANIVVSLDLHKGDRVGIQGSSGVGKSQLLRTIAGLEPVARNTVTLEGIQASHFGMPNWRRRVALVPQNRLLVTSSSASTPRESYQEALRFRSQRRYFANATTPSVECGVNGDLHKDPTEIAAAWDLPSSCFDQSWSTLSGGEAQRASLAITLALQPQVLLLDECTSALDAETCAKVENTLMRSQIPILLVSHAQAQLDRFCNRHLGLGFRVTKARSSTEQASKPTNSFRK